MSIISYINRNFFDINIVENKELKKELITILEELFYGYKVEKKTYESKEYLNNMVAYNVEQINAEVIKNIIEKKYEKYMEKIVDDTKEAKYTYATKDDIEYEIRYIYDKKRNIYSICCNLKNGVGVLHRNFGESFRINYDATCETLELTRAYLNENDEFITERNRYIKSRKNNIILMNETKVFDAFKLYYLEGQIPQYDKKYSDIYQDGKFSLENKIEVASSMLYLTDKTSKLPTELVKNIIVCNGIVAYNTKSRLKYDGIITYYDSINKDEENIFKNMPLYTKLKKLLKTYELKKEVDKRVKKYIKKDS